MTPLELFWTTVGTLFLELVIVCKDSKSWIVYLITRMLSFKNSNRREMLTWPWSSQPTKKSDQRGILRTRCSGSTSAWCDPFGHRSNRLGSKQSPEVWSPEISTYWSSLRSVYKESEVVWLYHHPFPCYCKLIKCKINCFTPWVCHHCLLSFSSVIRVREHESRGIIKKSR